MNQTQEIIWMMDGALMNAHPSKWDEIRKKSQEFINKMGNREFSHKIADPEILIKSLAPQIADMKPDTIVDLSGWMGKALESTFPQARIVENFHLSRVREASSPSLPTSGHIVSLSRHQRVGLSATIRSGSILLLDDTSFSGNTSEKAMNLLDLDPEKTTHGFLIANHGDLGDQPGSINRLEQMGSKVFSGMRIETPRQDGWHFQDTFNHPNLHEAMQLSGFAQWTMEIWGSTSLESATILSSELFKNIQFSQRLNPDEVNTLLKEERIIAENPQRLLNGETHTQNPILWISPYFAKHINHQALVEHHQKVANDLQQIKNLTSPIIHQKAIHEMKRAVEGVMWNSHPERRG